MNSLTIEGRQEDQRSQVTQIPGRLIRAEANLLRFPFFALTSKGLKNLDGIECSGRVSRNGQTHQFRLKATRNTATHYPGPLARSAHIAFLSILTDSGIPTQQPLQWSWRDLCRHMRITYSGRTVAQLKAAIQATAGIVLWSESALYSKAQGKILQTQEESLHLYDRVVFVGSTLPDGRRADTNYLWLSEWYRDNLNTLFTAPLDYSLWLYLDERSPIASRLYEFLLLNFHSPAPVLRINYETLTQFLPIHTEKYFSTAQRQLQTALTLLCEQGILGGCTWSASQPGIAQLTFSRGSRTHGPTRLAGISTPEATHLPDEILVRQITTHHPPEWQLVCDFYKLWIGNGHPKPGGKELTLARELLELHGRSKLLTLLPLTIKRLRTDWPEAKTFSAFAKYLPEVSADYDRRQRVAEQQKQAILAEQVDHDRLQADRKWKAETLERLRPTWESLSDEQRLDIEEAVRQRWPHIARIPAMFQRYCIQELANRQNLE